MCFWLGQDWTHCSPACRQEERKPAEGLAQPKPSSHEKQESTGNWLGPSPLCWALKETWCAYTPLAVRQTGDSQTVRASCYSTRGEKCVPFASIVLSQSGFSQTALQCPHLHSANSLTEVEGLQSPWEDRCPNKRFSVSTTLQFHRKTCKALTFHQQELTDMLTFSSLPPSPSPPGRLTIPPLKIWGFEPHKQHDASKRTGLGPDRSRMCRCLWHRRHFNERGQN